MILGIDTSCYTTSVAVCDGGKIICDKRKPLEVSKGNRGLRQSEAVFQHIKALPELIKSAADTCDFNKLEGVISSRFPRPCDGSYMPVFTAGSAFAESIAAALRVPLYYTSHQEGHIMAALKSCGKEPEDREFVSVHISGGTTELLLTEKKGAGFDFKLLGGSLDLHAGQLIDRCGVMMGMSFPCGRELDALALKAERGLKMPVTLKGADIHFSGAESYLLRYISENEKKEEIARGIFECIRESLIKALDFIYAEKPFKTVLMGGGVSASEFLRQTMTGCGYNILFADKRYSADNACGTSLIGELLKNE